MKRDDNNSNNYSVNSNRRNSDNNNSDDDSYSMFMVREEKDNVVCNNDEVVEFFLDTGVTGSCINDSKLFNSYNVIDVPIRLKTASKDASKNMTNVGNVLLRTNLSFEFELENVLYSKLFPCNLISLKSLCKENILPRFDINCNVMLANVNDYDKILGIGESLRGGLCSLHFTVIRRNVDNSHHVMLIDNPKVNLRHWRLGYVNFKTLKHMSNAGIVEKLKLSGYPVCGDCVKGKQSKSPHLRSSSRTTAPLQLIHTDVRGPMKTTSFNNKRYILTFIDDFTSFVTVNLLERKEEVFEKFKVFETFVSNKFNRSIV